VIALSLALAAIGADVSLVEYSLSQWRDAPEMRIEDAYKWLFQATLGGEHAVQDDAGPRAWLEAEWKRLGPWDGVEPRFVRLTPDSSLIRVNLRPYKATGGDCEMLLAVFVASARRFRADKARFLTTWRELGTRLAKNPVGALSSKEWKRLDRECGALGYPAVHHSSSYEAARRPAYRVVLGAMWITAETAFVAGIRRR
jgi:hypothetical protein